MISFSQLGARSRLGNHLFQYAFLRSAARRLGVPFYCPPWDGDNLFDLADDAERAAKPEGVHLTYAEPPGHTGLNASALRIHDGTDIFGYFQTEQYFRRSDVLAWYRFKAHKIESAQQRFQGIPFARATGLHVRLGDFATTYSDLYYVARQDYYRRALRRIGTASPLVVFSDDVPNAKRLLGELASNAYFPGDYEPYEGLYLQSQCLNFICSASSYSWWGAWLNTHPQRVIIAPREGPMRPGAPVRNEDYWPESWLKVRALRPVLDGYRAARLRRQFDRLAGFAMRRLGERR